MKTLKFKKLNPEAQLPTRANATDAGLDLTAISKKFDHSTGTYFYDTGLAVEIPDGYVGLIFPRSSIYKTSMSLTNAVGVIDSQYRGSIGFRFTSKGYEHNSYQIGDRVGQLVIVPISLPTPELSDTLSETDRGTGSFGSSGR